MAHDKLLAVRGLSVGLQRGSTVTPIIEQVDFDVADRQVLGIIGESGSGKTVLCHALVNALNPPLEISGGSVQFAGDDILSMDSNRLHHLRGDKIAFIGSNPYSALDPAMPVGAQLVEKLRAKNSDLAKRQAKQRVLDLLDAVHIPDPKHRFDELPHQYSGGMIQRVMIVDALLTEPDLVIADNITVPLDVTIAAQIMTLFRELRERVNAAFVFVSSSLPLVCDIADHICVLQNGRIIERSTPEEILKNPGSDYTRHLMASVPKIWQFTSAEQRRLAIEKPSDPDAPVIRISGVDKTYRTAIRNSFFRHNEVQAVRGVSLNINRGESFGLVGESGCGKSTLSRLITWLESPDSGSIEFLDHDVHDLSRTQRFHLRSRFQLLLQDPYNSIPPHLTIGRTIAEPLYIHQRLTTDAARIKVIQVMGEVGLEEELIDELPGRLSAGQRQRVNIARALVLKPDMIILDETLSGLDHGQQNQLLDLFDQLQRDRNLTYIYISHDLAMVRRACDRVAVMYLGEIVELGPTRQIFEQPSHPYTRALLSALATIEQNPFRKQDCLLDGEPPSPINLPPGCGFTNRCPHAMDICGRESPVILPSGPNSARACHLPADFSVEIS